MKIVVCGGGTAGHITPVLAVIDALRKFEPKAEILYVGTGAELESQLIAGRKITYKSIHSGKLRRYKRGALKELVDVKMHAQNASDVWRTVRGISESKKILKEFAPDVVFCKGGFVTVPMGIAAHKLKIPLVLHESDAIFGLSNRILSRWAKAIATGFPVATYSQQPSSKLVYSGNPVRASVIGKTRSNAKTKLKLTGGLPVVFAFGGSQGSAAINTAIFEGLEHLCKHFIVLHHAGKHGIEQARTARFRLPSEVASNYFPVEFLVDEMGDALAAADVVVARASTSSLMEIAANRRVAIVIPNKHSTGGHQQANAAILERAGAIRVITEDQLGAIRLRSEIDKLLVNTQATVYLAQTLHEFWRADSADVIAKTILEQARAQ